MADDKKALGPDAGTPAEAPEQPGPAPDLTDATGPAPQGLEVLTVEKRLILEHEGQAALFEMGVALPDAPEFPGVTLPEQPGPDQPEQQTATPGKVVDFATAHEEAGKTTPPAKKAAFADKEAKKPEKSRRGRPPKGDKTALGKTDPAKKGKAAPKAEKPKRDKMGLLTKCLDYIGISVTPGKKEDASQRQFIHRSILFKFKATAEKRQWSSAASKPRRKTRVKLWLHFCTAKVPSHQICRCFKASRYSGSHRLERCRWTGGVEIAVLQFSRPCLIGFA